MIRILFFVAIAFVFWLVVRTVGGSRGRTGSGSSAAPGGDPRPAIESITQCAWCGVHVPATAALTVPDGRLYCSEAHRDAARRTGEPADRSRG